MYYAYPFFLMVRRQVSWNKIHNSRLRTAQSFSTRPTI
jgi:hypothetical protein